MGIRDDVLTAIEAYGEPITADETAELIDRHFISVRPVITNLRQEGLIRRVGPQVAGQFGKPVHRYVYHGRPVERRPDG